MDFRPSGPRCGVAILVVLVVIAVTFALSYAVMRSQGTALLIQHNAHLGTSARQAAMTGLAAAIKKMHTDAWEGVDTTLSGTLGKYEGFQVTYTTGDPSLSAGAADYAEYPYRVTLLSTGYAVEPDDPQRVVTHRIQAVVRLVPRKLADEPKGWNDLTSHTLCQWVIGEFAVNAPFRVEGAVRVRGVLDLSQTQMAWPSNVRRRYFEDLNRMRLAGRPDWRPFTGPVEMFYFWQFLDTRDLLNTRMNVATSNASPLTEFYPPAGDLQTYRLYPGGKEYSVQSLDATLQNVTLEPDAKTNPLGLYSRTGQVRIKENVTIRGTLLTAGGAGAVVRIEGANVRFEPPASGPPPLSGSTLPIRLPALVTGGSVVYQSGAQVKIEGMLVAGDRFEIETAEQDAISLEIQGRIAARDVLIGTRKGWDKPTAWWVQRFDEFWNQREQPGGVPYFPEWLLKTHGLDPTPRLVVKPDAKEVSYHWQNPDDPLYVPHPDDVTELDPRHPGLRWELIGWSDNP